MRRDEFTTSARLRLCMSSSLLGKILPEFVNKHDENGCKIVEFNDCNNVAE